MASGIVESSQNSGSQETATGVAQSGQRSELAARLIDAPNLPAFVTELISTQATTVAGTEAVGFLIERQGEALGLRLLAHLRHDNSDAEVRSAAITAFQDLIKPCVQQLKDGAIDLGMTGDSSESQFCLVTLLRADGQVVAVSAVIARCLDLERARQRLSSMKLVAGYFELFTLRRVAEQSRMIAESHQHVLQLSTSVATAEGFESAAMNLCNELANRAHASRVTMGWVKGRNVRVKAISHTEEFDKKQELIVSLEKVMEECADQDQVVMFDPAGADSSQNVTREAATLSRQQGGVSVLSLPLRRRDEIIGVISAEFPAQQKLGPNVSTALTIAVDLLAPQLYDRYQNDRWLITKAGISLRETAKMAVGPQHTLGKLIAIASAAAVLFLIFFRPTYHVNASFEFASLEHRQIAAPYDGFIASVGKGQDGKLLKPGDKVVAGEVLAVLDTTDTRLKLAEAQARVNTKTKEAAKYRAEEKTAEEQVALSERDEAQQEADYLSDQINRASIVTPLAGQILKGDLEDKQGAPVKTGDMMFEVGSDQNLRAELTVADRDIQDLHLGQTGRLATKALPDQKYDFVIDRIIPIPDPKDGTNNFKVFATLKGKGSANWRPGMEGEARINVAPRSLAWIWTHRLFDFLKLKLWM